MRSLSTNRTDSVSSSSDDGGSPDSRSAARTPATNPGSRNCRADTFTDMCGQESSGASIGGATETVEMA
jgi:hypothetical protein